MDYFRFLNSNTMREYLKGINYQFSAPEAAYIVYESLFVTLEDKIAAWKSIIESISDCSMREHFNLMAMNSFHAVLKEYIFFLQKQGGCFYQKESTAYNYSVMFERMWFDFPTPFKRGDILCNIQSSEKRPFVLDYIGVWDKSRLIESGFHPNSRLVSTASKPSMRYGSYILGHYVGEAGVTLFYDDTGINYLDLERYKEPLTGEQIALTAVSEAISNNSEIDIVRLCNSYHWTLQELEHDNFRGTRSHGIDT